MSEDPSQSGQEFLLKSPLSTRKRELKAQTSSLVDLRKPSSAPLEVTESTTKRTVVALDAETTGFAEEGGSEELIQIGMKKENGASLRRFFLPSGPTSASAVSAHGLTVERLRREGAAPFGFADAMEILDFAGPSARVVMHNKAFDLGVLLKAFKAVKVHLPLKGTADRWETVCTQELAK